MAARPPEFCFVLICGFFVRAPIGDAEIDSDGRIENQSLAPGLRVEMEQVAELRPQLWHGLRRP
eukprot:918738-Lingulodinium_polyedra.AAC.1